MKLLDKYLLRTLLVPLAYCLAAFLLLYIVFDLFNNLGDFVEAGTTIPRIAQFYIYLLPSALFIIFPISLLLAILYALSSLTKTNELVAMRACGISLLRLMLPIVAVGLVVSISVTVVNETIAPYCSYWTYKFLKAEKNKGQVDVFVAHMLGFVNARENRDWMIGEFDTRTFKMKDVRLTQRFPDGASEKVQATRAEWLDGCWWFFEVVRQRYDKDGNPMGRVRFEPREEMADLTETPVDFLNEVKDPLENPEYVSAREIRHFMRTHLLAPSAQARLLVNLHQRLAMPWTALVVALFGIPLGTQSGRRGAFVGFISAIFTFFLFFALVQFCSALGKKGALDPVLAAWLPNALFFIAGCVLLYRMR
jgi:lipopolysaccharide export system permease protein